MADILLTGIGAGAAWLAALTLLRFSSGSVWFHACAVGSISAAIRWVLKLTQLEHLSPAVFLAVFLLMMLAVAVERHGDYSNGVLAFLVAHGAFSVFRFAEDYPIVAMILPIIFAVCAVRLQSSFPEQDWQEYFSGPVTHGKKLNVRKSYVYAVTAAGSILCSICTVCVQTENLVEALVLLVILCAVFWGSLLSVCILVEYRRESLAALLEQQYREEMQSFMNVIRSQRHDYVFHVQTLSRLLDSGNYSALKKYVDELVKDTVAMNTLLPVKDPAISALINNFRSLAAREGIELHIDIRDDLSHVATTVYETNKVISNLLQNAIDEVRTHEDKSYGIHLEILKRGEFCVIHVSNAFPQNVESGAYLTDIYRQGYTTKAGHDGVGLSSVRTLLSRYKGIIYTQVEEGAIRFTAKIPMRYKANEEDRMSREVIQ